MEDAAVKSHFNASHFFLAFDGLVAPKDQKHRSSCNCHEQNPYEGLPPAPLVIAQAIVYEIDLRGRSSQTCATLQWPRAGQPINAKRMFLCYLEVNAP
ncbi:uncharacterized protein EMH_0030090 [Eimeria mitis]|uniref:Uncharacterized protein n=1 Tax=Eimeria mitis TaxID=44415 RepID=U6JUQ5_9EIME|nr:uncharacterized protein EMH_0030090 [Eimeria mitis]CDJ27253.1 hypothetical protein EMH_0030090 [Eimeria mitis]